MKPLNPKFKFLIFVGIVVISIFLANVFSIDPQAIEKYFSGFSLLYSGAAFVLLYVIGTFILWHLKDPLKIVGAIIFGAYISTFLIYIAEIVNAYIFFNISSVLGRDFVEKKLGGRFKRFYEKLEDVNLGWLFLLRLVPLIPYRVLDMSFGLSRMRFKRYFIVVILASPLRIFWIQFVLAAVKSMSPEKIMLYFRANNSVFLWSLIYLIFTCIIAFKIKAKFR